MERICLKLVKRYAGWYKFRNFVKFSPERREKEKERNDSKREGRRETKPFLAPCFTWLIRISQSGVPYTRLVPRNLCSQSDHQHPSKDIWVRANRQRRAYTKWHHTISEVCAQMMLQTVVQQQLWLWYWSSTTIGIATSN